MIVIWGEYTAKCVKMLAICDRVWYDKNMSERFDPKELRDVTANPKPDTVDALGSVASYAARDRNAVSEERRSAAYWGDSDDVLPGWWIDDQRDNPPQVD